jgi:hypothetical protein
MPRNSGNAATAVEGFDRVLLRWRYENTAAAIRFVDTLL